MVVVSSVFLRLLVSVMSLFFSLIKKTMGRGCYFYFLCVFHFRLCRFSSFFNLKKNYVAVDVTSFGANLQNIIFLSLCHKNNFQKLK